MSDVTRILNSLEQGDASAADQLLPLVYDELRRLAAHKMANEKPGQTLQATALVHEAYLRLVGNQNQRWSGRAHFFGAAAEAMRRILIENARRKSAQRHGGGQQRVDIEEVDIASPAGDDQLLAVNDAIEKLAAIDPAKAELVKLRYFVGLSMTEAARALGLPQRTVERQWAFAKAWLREEIKKGAGG